MIIVSNVIIIVSNVMILSFHRLVDKIGV
jgi:hypothetical protein